MDAKKRKILIIEDEKPLARALELKLTHEGFEVQNIPNGEEFVSMVEKNDFSLILCDLVMPKMDGLTMLKKIKENSDSKNVKFIFLTNLDGIEEISSAMKLSSMSNNGSFEYFVKSDVTLDQVVDKIKEKLEDK